RSGEKDGGDGRLLQGHRRFSFITSVLRANGPCLWGFESELEGTHVEPDGPAAVRVRVGRETTWRELRQAQCAKRCFLFFVEEQDVPTARVVLTVGHPVHPIVQVVGSA